MFEPYPEVGWLGSWKKSYFKTWVMLGATVEVSVGTDSWMWCSVGSTILRNMGFFWWLDQQWDMICRDVGGDRPNLSIHFSFLYGIFIAAVLSTRGLNNARSTVHFRSYIVLDSTDGFTFLATLKYDIGFIFIWYKALWFMVQCMCKLARFISIWDYLKLKYYY